MANRLSLASVLEANRIDSEFPLLCLLDLEIVHPDTGVVVLVEHIVRNPEPVTFNGNTYEPGKFDLELKQVAGGASEVSLSVSDLSQTIQGYMEAYGGGVGSNVTIYLAFADDLTRPPEMVEYFQIVSASTADYTHSFTLGAENCLAVTFPRRRQLRDFCQWRYRGSDCGYSGSLPSCSYTLQGPNGCEAHGNSRRFGAYPGINNNGYRYA